MALALFAAAAGAAEPLVHKFLFDGLTERTPTLEHVATAAALLLGLGLLREAVASFSNCLTWRTRIAIQYDLTEATVGRLHMLPLTYHQASEGVGATISRLDRGTQGFVAALSEIAFNVVPALVYLAISVTIMLRLDWRLALLVLAFAPVPGLIASLAAPVQTAREKNLLQRWATIYARFNEVLSGIAARSGPGRPTWTWGRCTGTARRSGCWRRGGGRW